MSYPDSPMFGTSQGGPLQQSNYEDRNPGQSNQMDLDRNQQHIDPSIENVTGRPPFAETQYPTHEDGGYPPPISEPSRVSPPSSYLDPLILADNGYHGGATTSRNNLTPILPKPTSHAESQGGFSWNNQVNAVQKRAAEDALIDPRLAKSPRYDSGTPAYTYPDPSNSPAVQVVNPALELDGDHSLVDSATDALLERQLELQDGSEESEAENRQRNRYNSDGGDEPQRGRRGRKRGRGGRTRGAKRGPRKAAEPTGDVKWRISMASNAYLNNKPDEAMKYVEEAIRINAETYRAWTLLATLLEDKRDFKGSFTARVFSCHLQPKNVEGWINCAELGIALRDNFPDDAAHFLEQASICYSAALRADIGNQPARHSRAAIAFERGQIRTAAKDYLYLLEHGGEYDIHALRAYAEMTIILASTRKRSSYKPESAIDWYRRAFDHFRVGSIDQPHPIEWQDINIFVGLLAYVEHTKDAIFHLKLLARWLMGRSSESFWDDWQDDDREWDIDDVRRTEYQEFKSGTYPQSSYGSGLPLDLRAKLAVYRIKLGDLDEAQRHMNQLDPDGPNGAHVLSNEPHLLAEIGSALYDSDLRDMTLRFLEPLLSIPDVLDSAALLAAGRCYLDAGDKRQAEECFGAAIDADESNDEASIDARYELAKMYEAAREEQEAYILVNEAIRLQQAHDEAEGEDDEDEMGSDDEARNRSGARTIRKARLKKQRAPRQLKPRAPKPKVFDENGNEVRRSRPRRKVFGRSDEVTLEEKRRDEELATAWRTIHRIRGAHDPNNGTGPSITFMRAAKDLVDDFRSCKGFYPWEKYLVHLGINEDRQVYVSRNRNLIEMKERLSHNLNPFEPNTERQLGERTAVSYRGVSFSEWLELFLEYAIGLAHNERFQESYQVCESARDAEVFAKNRDDMFLIHVTWAACALRARDEETCVAAARFLMRDRQFDSDPFRMFAALCRLCPSPASWYASGPVQKYMLRQIKLMDRALVSGGGEDKDSDEEETRATSGRVYPSKDLDITLLVLYGHILFVSNSFTYALNYFLRAYSIDPTNHMVLLSVGQCYIHYALKRQSENRQYLLVQGFVFLHRYYDLKVSSSSSSADAAQRQEAHYNMARSYHAIGIPHLAAQFYQRVLRDIPDESSEQPAVLSSSDLSHEAAYNLQQICWAGGDLEAIKSLGERYLTL
ncbi:hypothetical protein F5Y08DRAFT_181973 [Xylaria arbuscula]|nr:hypothetical protein F5Y08DRAFT_181973 [Xylaria arbuscula]